MTYEDFVKENLGRGLLKAQKTDVKAVEHLMARARKDLRAARAILDIDEGIAYTTAYMAMLRAGRALMLAKGLRPADGYQHKTVAEFVAHTKLEEIIKKVYRQVDQAHADTVIDHVEAKADAERFFRDLRAYYDVRLFPRTSIDKLLSIPTNQPWYKFLDRTDDFEILEHVQSGGSEQWSDILTHRDTNVCISIGGDLSNDEINKLDDYEKGFRAFAELTVDQRREIIKQFAAANKSFHRIARKTGSR